MCLPDYMLSFFENCHYFILIDSFLMHVLKLKSISDTIYIEGGDRVVVPWYTGSGTGYQIWWNQCQSPWNQVPK